ncbi:chemotaxis protein CheW [Stakelama pacifica]|uniref:CheW protein n=1 Tax=Stakelama pacifica TaxID=517720 RepID=A0A4R6FWX0_9SPHN|nr:chemotaxis protein CheW [Stakelama pacifica]TDN86466.1 CheW protein [Stakelama pacifica]GGO89726.1 chemotaxis protein CheW [Stakelama pacifica]
MADSAQYVTMGVAGECFALPVERVREILENRQVSRMPHAPAGFLGLIDVRNQSVPVFDLRVQLGFENGEDNDATRIVVLTMVAEDMGEMVVGLKTDRVFEVTVLDDDGAIDPPPSVGPAGKTKCVLGLGRRNGAFVKLLDIDRLFSTQQIGAIGDGQSLAA